MKHLVSVQKSAGTRYRLGAEPPSPITQSVEAKMNSTSASSVTVTPLKRKNETFARPILILLLEGGQEIKSFRASKRSQQLRIKAETSESPDHSKEKCD